MNKALTLSIVIPVYNEENYLKSCLDAIAAQTVVPDEVIVVDNNSTDNSLAIARSYDFVKIIKEPRQGIIYTRNAGFNAATSDIIGRIDGDTVLPLNWVRRVKQFYKNEHNRNHALTGGGYYYNLRFPRFNGWIQSQVMYRTNRFVMGYYILWGSNMALPRWMWEEAKDKVCLRDDVHEDVDLALHIHSLGYPITYRAKLRVGVELKRVWSSRRDLKVHLQRLPNTFRLHGYRLWWVTIFGNVIFVWLVVRPLALFGGASRPTKHR